MLAGGPYGPSDLAGAMNASLVMRSCRADGVLLRADKPATVLDAAWSASFDDLVPRRVEGAFTDIGTLRWSYILSLNLDDPFSLAVTDLGGPATVPSAEFVACDFGRGCAEGPWTALSVAAGPLKLPACPQVDDLTPGWGYRVVAPVLPSGWVLLGEVEKIVPVSGRRFLTVASGVAPAPELEAVVAAATGETVVVTLLTPGKRRPVVVTCTAPSTPPPAGAVPACTPTPCTDLDPDHKLTLACVAAQCSCTLKPSPVTAATNRSPTTAASPFLE